MLPKVLMIDDNLGDRQLIEEAFKDWRMRVDFTGVADGDAAFAHLREAMDGNSGLPDVIIVDLDMPSISGEAVLKILRADPLSRRIPTVMFSGSCHAALAQSCLAAGATAVVEKPKTYREYVAFAQGLSQYWTVAAKSAQRAAAKLAPATPPRTEPPAIITDA